MKIVNNNKYIPSDHRCCLVIVPKHSLISFLLLKSRKPPKLISNNENRTKKIIRPLIIKFKLYIIEMGYYFMDQFSLLHFSVGVIMYFWNFSLLSSFIIHFIFEILENSPTGIFYIQKYVIKPGLFDWPGGKSDPDSTMNIIGDNVFFVLGWIVAYYCDYYGRKYEFYTEEGLKKFWD